MSKTKVLRNFQKLTLREMKKETPRNASEVKLESVGTRLMSAMQRFISGTEKIE